MRRLFCVTADAIPRSTCKTSVHVDVWSVHPYTSGGPTHKAYSSNDLSMGDLGKVRPILAAAKRLGHLTSAHPVRFWVTEFSWDTNPPDPKGVPSALHARWVAEALYRMWQNGVSLAMWFEVRDEPLATSDFQSGLYYRGATLARDRPKPALTAFRFPFVAYAGPSGVQIWGRTPTSSAGRVLIEQELAGHWRRVASLTANRYGIFKGRVKAASAGAMRARAAGAFSLPFALPPPSNEDLIVTPFGK
jgi:hypothetical protein